MLYRIFCLVLINFYSIVCDNFFSVQFETIPHLKNNNFAFGLNQLQLQATVNVSKSGNVYCFWEGLQNCQKTQFFNDIEGCFNSSNCLSISSCFDIVKGKRFKTTALFKNLKKSLNVTITCLRQNPFNGFSWNSIAKNCSTSVPLLVNSSSSIFMSSGNFYCSNSGTLVYSNGTKLDSSQTTCLASAQWNGQDGLQCWKAPYNVELIGNSTAVEGENITFNCNYSASIPAGNGTELFIEDIGNLTSKNEQHVIVNVQRNYHHKSVFCQVMTPYTKKFNISAGRSPEKKLDILYTPQFSSETCIWFVNSSGSCNVTVDSNPLVSFVLLKKDAVKIPISMNSFDNFYYQIIKLSDTVQVFTFNKKKVNKSDNGSYEFVVKSNLEPTNHDFFIVVENDSGTYAMTTYSTKLKRNNTHMFTVIATNNFVPLIPLPAIIAVAAVIGSAVFVVLLLVLGIYCKKKKGRGNNGDNAKVAYRTKNKSGIDPEPGGLIQNELYGTSNRAENVADSVVANEIVYAAAEAEENPAAADVGGENLYDFADEGAGPSHTRNEPPPQNQLEPNSSLPHGVLAQKGPTPPSRGLPIKQAEANPRPVSPADFEKESDAKASEEAPVYAAINKTKNKATAGSRQSDAEKEKDLL